MNVVINIVITLLTTLNHDRHHHYQHRVEMFETDTCWYHNTGLKQFTSQCPWSAVDCLFYKKLITRWDTRTWRDTWSSYLFTYLPPNYR